MNPNEMEPALRIERSIIKKFRHTLWQPFLTALNRYSLIEEGDSVAVCISGGKDSMLLAKMMELIRRYGHTSFDLTYLAMDPGYSAENRRRIEENAARMGLPLTVFETDIFRVAGRTERNPCYLCARMRRGHLYAKAKALGCNKIALGHHFNDVIETTLIGMFYGSQLQGMLPKLHSDNFEGMTLIRPLYMVHEKDILAWARYNDLHFIQCACRMTEAIAASEDGQGSSKRQEVKQLLAQLKKTNPLIEQSIFNSLHAVCLDTMPGYKADGVSHSFLEKF